MPRPRRLASRSASFSGSGAFIGSSPRGRGGLVWCCPPRPTGGGPGSAPPGPKGIIGVAVHRRIRALRPGAVIMGRVLLVDDDLAMTLEQVTYALRPQGIRVEVAQTA